jgi:hypothetical protein
MDVKKSEDNSATPTPGGVQQAEGLRYPEAAVPRWRLEPGLQTAYLNKYRRFFRAPRHPIPSVEDRGVLLTLRRWLDRHLTHSPPTLDRGIRNVMPQDPNEIAVEQDKAYLAAEQEFANAPEGTVDAWIEREQLATTWFDSEEYRKARRNSVLASFTSILVTHTGLYPTKIPAIGVDFPQASKPVFLGCLLLATWYLTLGMNIIVRGYLIDKAFLEIKHAKSGIYRNFENRYTRFIKVTSMERGFFALRFPFYFLSFSM